MIFGIDQLLAVRFELTQRAFLVCTHQPAIAHNVGRHNGGKPAVSALLGHEFFPSLRRAEIE